MTRMSNRFGEIALLHERTVVDMPFREHIEAYTFLQVISDPNGLAVLDLGCGGGLYTRRLRALGAARAVGIDVSPGMLHYAKQREAEERIGIEYNRAGTATMG